MDGPTIATLIVAGGTLLLAWATFRLGTRAAEETRAQWRPVLLVRARQGPGDQKIVFGGAYMTVDIENVGRGPALNITVRRTAEWIAHQTISALAPSEVAQITVPAEPGETEVGVSMSYSDLSKAGYGTSVVIDPRGPSLTFQHFETRAPLGGLRSLVPRRFRPRVLAIRRWWMRRRAFRSLRSPPD